MLDVGDVYTQTFTLTDSTGTLVDATSNVCTVTLPDLTTATPTLTHASTGTYVLTYTVTQSGQHHVTVQWAGTNATETSDVFWAAATDPGFVISLADARAGLRLPAGQTVDDEDLRDLIASSTPVLEDLVGPIVAQACDEWHDGGGSSVRLLQAPLIAVTTVVESFGGGYTRTLANEPLGGSSYDAFGYTVDLSDGLVIRRFSGSTGQFAPGRRNIHVQYTAGRTVLPANLRRAMRRLVRFMWQQEMQGQRPSGSVPESVGQTPSGFLVPNAVKTLCAGELRTVGQG